MATPGRLLELQRSSDLAHWEKIAEINNPFGMVEYVDTPSDVANQYFYRALLP